MGELAKVRLLNPAEQQQRIDALERQVGALQAVIAALRAELEQLTRRGKRQAALEGRLTARTLPGPDNEWLLDQERWHHTRGIVLRFLSDPRLEPTNNRAERALRPAVIARKVSQCSKHQRGADTFAAFVSVTRTFRQRGGTLLDDLLTTFLTGRALVQLPP